MKPIIKVKNLSKQYFIGGEDFSYATVRDSLIGLAKGIFKPSRESSEKAIWALRNVTFEVQPGEVIGIVGRNGAGKSTLLKILSRIVEPTTGSIELYGRMGSLLEVGTGFHPELTGRENIYLNGAILGMKRKEIIAKFDEIVAFAEIEKFIDTPVKHYSSGMYMRLAFAVAAHLEPEILIVDEVLAVGDAAFQRKCLGKMGDVAKQGRTVLFVSHNMTAIGRLCMNAIYLENGKVVGYGEASAIISKYLSSAGSGANYKNWTDEDSAPGDDYVRLQSVRIQNADHNSISNLRQDEAIKISICYQVLQPMLNAAIGFELKAEDGTVVFCTYDADSPEWTGRGRKVGDYKVDCIIPANLLNEGIYYITLTAGIPFAKLCLRAEDVLKIAIDPSAKGQGPAARIGARRPGIIAPELHWEITSA